jgi:hypothetical protein
MIVVTQLNLKVLNSLFQCPDQVPLKVEHPHARADDPGHGGQAAAGDPRSD